MNRNKLFRIHQLTGLILAGLDGRVVTLGQGQRIAYTKILASIGITLVTKTQIEKRGYTLKRGQKPVVNAYFGAPIQTYADLYVLEIQCSKAEKEIEE